MRAALAFFALSAGAGCLAPTAIAPPLPPALAVPESPTSVDFQTLRGTKQPSTAITINGAVVVALDESGTWESRVELDEGTNNFSVVAVDSLGQESTPNPVTILLDTSRPDAPALDPAPPARTQDAALALSGAMGPSDRLVVNGEVVATAGSDFSVTRPLALGDNRFRVAARDIAGNESEIVAFVVKRVDDTDPPVVTLAAPEANALVGATFTVEGSVTDADIDDGVPVAVSVCVGACPNGPLVVTSDAAGAFSAAVDVGAEDPGAPDDADLTVTVTAADEWGNTSDDVVVSVLRVEGPAAAGGTAATLARVAALGDAPFAAAVLFVDGDGSVNLAVDDGGGWDPTADALGTAAAPGDAAAAALVVDEGGVLHAAWADAGPGEVAYRQRGAGKSGALAAREVVASGFVAESVDVAVLSDGTPLVAYIDDAGVVAVEQRNPAGGGFDLAPVVVSDATTAAAAADALANVAGVRLAVSPGAGPSAGDDVVTVVWQERSDRDGDATDDADIVAARFTVGDAPSAPVVVSAARGAFVDGESTAPRIASLAGAADVAIAFIDDGGGAFVTVIDDGAFAASPTLPEPVAAAASGVADLALAARAGAITLALVDDTGALTLRSGAPGGALGAAQAVSSPVSSPAVALNGAGGAAVAFIAGGVAELLPLVEAP